MPDTANTQQGTDNGGNIVAPTGNAFLSSLAALTNVLGSGLGQYSSFLDARAARKAEAAQDAAPAVQNVPNIVKVGLLSGDPKDLQQTFLYVGGASLVAIAAFMVLKKAL